MTPLVSRSDEQGITHLSLRRFLTAGMLAGDPVSK
jgi:hypothetical protein